MSEYDFDLFTIGAGSGGVRASRLAAQMGLRVGVAEEDREGGTCVVRGCIPKKLFVSASHVPEILELARGFDWTLDNPSHNWPGLRDKVQAEVNRLATIYRRNLGNAGAEIFHERAVVTGPNTVRLEKSGREVTAKKILIATGARPFLPPQVKNVHLCKTSDDMFLLDKLPERMVIVGGGYIAVEFAGIMHGFGVDVTLIYRGAEILRGFDLDLRVHLQRAMEKKGIKILIETDVKGIEQEDNGLVVLLKDDTEIRTDLFLCATGRVANTDGLGLESAGVELAENGSVKVDEYFKTSCDSIYALGDVVDGSMQLTPVAIREAICFVETVFKNNPTKMDYENIPTAVFSQPPIGTVGMSDVDVMRKNIPHDVYKSHFRTLQCAFTGSHSHMLMKLIVEQGTEKVLGAHIMGPDAPEMIQMLGVAVKMGATKADLDATVAVHPTAAEEMVTMHEKYIPE